MENKVEGSRTNNVIQHGHHMLTSYPTHCYDLESLEWDSKTTLVLSNTRELDRVPKTK